jgi:hypothetical protein
MVEPIGFAIARTAEIRGQYRKATVRLYKGWSMIEDPSDRSEQENAVEEALALLRPKQRAFVKAYTTEGQVTCGNGKQSAIKAGYSLKSAESTASEILSYPKVKSALEAIEALKRAEVHETEFNWRLEQEKVYRMCLRAKNWSQANAALASLGKHLGQYSETAGQPVPDIVIQYADDRPTPIKLHKDTG